MKARLLLFFILISAGVSAQAVQKKVSIRTLHHSAAGAPIVGTTSTSNDTNVTQAVLAGSMTVYTEDPLIVAEDPIATHFNSASVVVDPALSSMTIDFEEEIPQQRVTVAISCEDGQLIKCQSFFPKERKQTVTLPNLKSTTLTASRYNIAVYGEDKRVLYWGQLVK